MYCFSNGVKGHIHVSQSTADALTESGKGHWLTEREDRIVAKGKGEMTTYFVNISGGTATSVGTSSVEEQATAYTDDDDDDMAAVGGGSTFEEDHGASNGALSITV